LSLRCNGFTASFVSSQRVEGHKFHWTPPHIALHGTGRRRRQTGEERNIQHNDRCEFVRQGGIVTVGIPPPHSGTDTRLRVHSRADRRVVTARRSTHGRPHAPSHVIATGRRVARRRSTPLVVVVSSRWRHSSRPPRRRRRVAARDRLKLPVRPACCYRRPHPSLPLHHHPYPCRPHPRHRKLVVVAAYHTSRRPPTPPAA
jgi:hypothetical protein